MAGEMADELCALYHAVGKFKEGSMRWGSVSANGVRFVLVPTDQMTELMSVYREAEEVMAAMDEPEGGKD